MSKAEELAEKAYPVGDTKLSDAAPSMCRNAFIEGYHQAEKDLLDNIWHNPDEEPEIDRKIIWESENFLGKHLDREWKPMIDCFGRKEKWCYLADILPSKNWTGERPYSKVDYNKGYDNGYEQAEKDLELTWEDIEFIVNIDQDTNNEESIIGVRKNEEHYQEVLKRFKERKGK